MIQLKNISYKTPTNIPLLTNINLTIDKGEFLVLTGPSGSGKTTLLNVLNGLAPELYEGLVTGEGVVGESQLPVEDFSSHIKQFGVVFQNPKTHFFTTDVFSELAFVMENNGYPVKTIQSRIEEVSQFFELEPFAYSSMFHLSGGQKQLVSIAAATMLNHRLLLLDEPSSNLDFLSITKLKKILLKLKNQGITILVADHRLSYLMDLADRFVLLDDGQVVKEYTKNEMMQLTQEQRKQAGLRSIEPIAIKEVADICEKKQPTIQVEIRDLTCNFSKKAKNTLEISNLQFDNGSIIGIIGENGAGKSTFFDLLSGLRKPKSGEILFNGQKTSRKKRLEQSFLVMQDVNLQLFFETVEKELITQATRMDRFDELCDLFHLTQLLQRHPHTLSGGEKQRVAIASALLSGKKVLLFDEPTSGLDYRSMKEVSQVLKKVAQEEVLLLVVSHDEEFLQETCSSIIPFKNGKYKSNESTN